MTDSRFLAESGSAATWEDAVAVLGRFTRWAADRRSDALAHSEECHRRHAVCLARRLRAAFGLDSTSPGRHPDAYRARGRVGDDTWTPWVYFGDLAAAEGWASRYRDAGRTASVEELVAIPRDPSLAIRPRAD